MTEDREVVGSKGSAEILEPKDEAKAAIYESVEANTGYEPTFEEPRPAERRLDLNSASEEELQALPGIGPELAARIVADRVARGGFREPAEVTRVPGITPEVYALFAGRVTTGEQEEEPIVEEDQVLPVGAAADADEQPPPIPQEPPELEEGEVSPVGEPVQAAQTPPPPLAPPPRPGRAAAPPPRQGLGWPSLLLTGLLSAVAGALLALLVLWLLNGTLDVQQSAERRLRSEVFRLEGDLEVIRAEVGGVEGRLGELEGLPGDVQQAQDDIRALGSSVEGLRADIGTASRRLDEVGATLAGLSDDLVNVEEGVTTLNTQLGDMEARLGTMTEELAEAQKAVTRFAAFLDGLRALLSEPEAVDGTATEVPPLATMTPLAGPTGAATSAATSTPRANVTVIPLATPTPAIP